MICSERDTKGATVSKGLRWKDKQCINFIIICNNCIDFILKTMFPFRRFYSYSGMTTEFCSKGERTRNYLIYFESICFLFHYQLSLALCLTASLCLSSTFNLLLDNKITEMCWLNSASLGCTPDIISISKSLRLLYYSRIL